MRASMEKFLRETWLVVALLALWWIMTANSTSPFWPPLGTIFEAIQRNWLFEHFETDLVPSLQRLAGGLVIAGVVGIGAGLWLGSSPRMRRALEPPLEFLRAFPSAAILPIALVLFGATDSQKVFIIAFGTVWPLLLNTIDGVRGIELGFHDTARIYGFRRRDRFLRVVLPGASPQIFVGLRVGLAQGLLLMVVAELYGSTDGIGHFIFNAQAGFAIADMWSGLFVLAIFAYLVNGLFSFLEHRVLWWHRGWRGGL